MRGLILNRKRDGGWGFPKWFLCFITNFHFCSHNKYLTEDLC